MKRSCKYAAYFEWAQSILSVSNVSKHLMNGHSILTCLKMYCFIFMVS